MAEQEKQSNMITRQPVVVIMGHVDHGKSSLLEAIREGFVITAKESGGITQHIGVYEVIVPLQKEMSSRASQQAGEGPRPEILRAKGAQDDIGARITFIDTPGHEAFSAMRSRGAYLADIAILVIDASEGMKPQTKEALGCIKKAGIPFIVAFSKIDKPGADSEKVKRELSNEDITVESWGGKIVSCEVSAKTKQGIGELLEAIILVAEMEELKADLTLPCSGIIIESSMDAKKGPSATLLVKQGALRKGDIIATERVLGKVRGLADFQGNPAKEILPGQPSRVLGFSEPPAVGEVFKVFSDKEAAQKHLKTFIRECPKQQVIETKQGVKILNIILKTDVLGSCEAVVNVLSNLPQDKVILRFLKNETGDINTSDILLAENGKARIFGFRVKADEKINYFAEQKKIKVKTFDIIYELAQEVRKAMTSVLSSEMKRTALGKFKAMIIFKQDKDTQIVGGRVLDGQITKNTKAEVVRDDEVLGTGRVKNMQKDKKDIGKAEKGQEIALLFQSETAVQENDILMVFSEEMAKGVL